MKHITFLITCALFLSAATSTAQTFISTSEEGADNYNTWIAFVKDFDVDKVPAEAVAAVTADSKYWMWINGEQAVFEGCLKRGPRPGDSYMDKVDIAPYLKQGSNRIAILVWHFGKSGFSHIDSGRSWLMLDAPSIGLKTDDSWICRIHPAYGSAGDPKPNFRLSEANLSFDSRLDIGDWQNDNAETLATKGFAAARLLDNPGCGKLDERPIPQWKDFGIKKIEKLEHRGDSTIAVLPYNMQMTPVLDIYDPEGGHTVLIKTDHAYHGCEYNNWAQYITRPGHQTYESLGWLNGEQIHVICSDPGVQVKGISYRETGYDTFAEGSFSCSDPFYNKFWEKGLRTLYINMRDTFFDCPDRERAQWWGDTVVLMGECFYTYSTSTHALMRKAIRELCAWAAEDGALHSPIPGNYNDELPGQMLAAIGQYGFWNYYMNTGDKETIAEVYPAVKKYLSLWEVDETGLTKYRVAGWNWGDWGQNKDMRLIFAGWHSLALQSAANMARLLGFKEDAAAFDSLVEGVKAGFNLCWDGREYRSVDYKGDTDDRVHALAVLAGIAPQERYDAVLEVLKAHENASPYMEKYVMEALFKMGQGRYALERDARRFNEMVSDPVRTTLFEGWTTRDIAAGGGTTNHAWSGGTLTVLAQELLGVRPLKAGYKVFSVTPDPAGMENASLTFPTVKGLVGCSFKTVADGRKLEWTVTVPRGSKAKFSYAGRRRTLRRGTHTFTTGTGNR